MNVVGVCDNKIIQVKLPQRDRASAEAFFWVKRLWGSLKCWPAETRALK